MVRVAFCHPLRDEQKFSSLEALIEQINRDTAAARDWHTHAAHP
jgi:FAD synthase